MGSETTFKDIDLNYNCWYNNILYQIGSCNTNTVFIFFNVVAHKHVRKFVSTRILLIPRLYLSLILFQLLKYSNKNFFERKLYKLNVLKQLLCIIHFHITLSRLDDNSWERLKHNSSKMFLNIYITDVTLWLRFIKEFLDERCMILCDTN